LAAAIESDTQTARLRSKCHIPFEEYHGMWRTIATSKTDEFSGKVTVILSQLAASLSEAALQIPCDFLLVLAEDYGSVT